MGRVVQNAMKGLMASESDRWLFFVRNPAEIAPVSEWVRSVNPGADFAVIHSNDLAKQRVDICWYPWNRVDAMPQQGIRIVTINDVNPFVFPYKSIWRWWDQRKDEQRFRRAAAVADCIITISQFSRQEITRYLGVDPQRVKVVSLGVDEKWFFADVSATESTVVGSQQQDGPRLLYVGSDDERKNLHSLIQAVIILRQQLDCKATLVCCGLETDAAEKYRRIVSKAGLAAAVSFEGFVSDDRLRGLYQQSDIFVFPSLYEGFGLPVLEAMAARCPVVSSQAASLPEVGGDAAVYCDAGNPTILAQCICDTWRNPELRNRLREAGAARARQFSWRNATGELKRIFLASMKEKRPMEG